MLSGSTILGGWWVGWVGGWLNTDYKASLSPQLKLGLGLGLSLAIKTTQLKLALELRLTKNIYKNWLLRSRSH